MKRDDRTWFSFAAAYAAPLLLLGALVIRRWRGGRRGQPAARA